MKRKLRSQTSDDDSFSDGRLVIDCNFPPDSGSFLESSTSKTRSVAEKTPGSARKRASGRLEKHATSTVLRTPSHTSKSNSSDLSDTSASRRKRGKFSRLRLYDVNSPEAEAPSFGTEAQSGTATAPDAERSKRGQASSSRSRSFNSPSSYPLHLDSMGGSDEDSESVFSFDTVPTTSSTPVSASRRRSDATPALTSPSKRRGRPRRQCNLTNTRKVAPVVIQFNRGLQMSLISQPAQTDWLSSRRESTSLSTGDAPAIKVRRPSDSSVDAVDNYCWFCHCPGQVKPCSKCPRVYHPRCVGSSDADKASEAMSRRDWRCPVCCELDSAASDACVAEKWLPLTSTATYEAQLQKALAFMVDMLSMQSWAEPFREPVDDDDSLNVTDVIRYPMDLRTLLGRVNEGRYKSTHAFLADFRWIIHNCFILENKSDSPLLAKVRSLEQTCLLEVSLLRACPTCYLNRTVALPVLPSTTFVFPAISKCEPRIYRRPELRKRPTDLSVNLAEGLWFIKPCPVVHPLVWVRFDDGQQWPGKMMDMSNGLVVVAFFGDYSSRTTPSNFVTFHTRLGVAANVAVAAAGCSGLKPSTDFVESRDAKTLDRALGELRRHVALILEAHPNFRLPSPPLNGVLPFTTQTLRHCYGPFNRWLPQLNAHSPNPHQDDPPLEANNDDAESTASPGGGVSPPHQPPPTPPPAPPPKTPPPRGALNSASFIEPLLVRLASVSQHRDASGFHELSSQRTPATAPPTASQPDPPPPLQTAPEEREERQGHFYFILWKCAVQRLLAAAGVCFGSVDHCDGAAAPTDIHALPQLTPTQTAPPPAAAASAVRPPSSGPDVQADLSAGLLNARTTLCEGFRSLLEGVFEKLEGVVCQSQAPAAPNPKVAVSVQEKHTQTTTSLQPTTTATSIPSLSEKTKTVLLKSEILRQNQELERLRLLLDYSRYEISNSQRAHLVELRSVWEAELTAVVEAVAKVCEQEAMRIIDQVKQKQWVSRVNVLVGFIGG
ncbi:unnamed protein product [Mesocestoides corti]|uniref:Bromo domain-containing protein n=1 Tax=Mesocestoides corti TaxID=53468 RepID=A0A158QSS3_MESCO|nr:unnamed protein product [Mesocestoides corti]